MIVVLYNSINAANNREHQMTITAAQLNEVANLLGTTDKNVVFSCVIQTLVKQGGISVNDAFDMLFGEGAYMKFAGEVYNALRAA